ncbi:VIT multi-domain protein [Pyrenophora teres f. maculata]|nr:VIT multi-domain protein [Pyrenophora teres f. maculata]
MFQQQSGQEYVSGLYYRGPFNGWRQEKNFLPQIQMEAHATILATASRTVLTQTFVNPSTEKGIRECRYMFPLYDGVSVVGFVCHVGERTIVGEVKEKEKARAVYQEATARGEAAGLLEQLPEASDVFTTTVGNIPPGAKVIIKITYLGELKHDMEVDGIRFTIPTIICPRYSRYPGGFRTTPATNVMGGSISIVVDAEMPDGSFIQRMQSPTHPIAMTMGTTSVTPNAEPTMKKASATLTLGTAELETDFVLQIIAKNTGIPKAIIENHPTIPNHRALMATLVPKFSLRPESPEIVFVCDRSGSMQTSIGLARQALQVFLKSLPIGVKFNICSFGNTHSFLWPKSVTYNQETLDLAMNHVNSMTANYGGTEMLQPLQATIEERYKDMALDIMLLTDGEIWNQHQLFSYLNQSVLESKDPIRVFTLGVGSSVSHALIEGIAKAGNGFSQAVGHGEKMDKKVVRMLKGALSPHITDYTLEVRYSNKDLSTPPSDDDLDDFEDFEIIEKVVDSLKVKLDLQDKGTGPEKTQKSISLFDPTTDPDEDVQVAHDETGEQRYAYLPSIPVPKIIQAPQQIPSLFAFNRTTVYLLLRPEATQATPQSVVLRGTSVHGPLELEIPIQILDTPGETIHQLAAKKAISELEQGRGWTSQAKEESDVLIKTKFEGRYEDMVEQEAVRLGIQFQVGGKWCSFVSVEAEKSGTEEQDKGTKDWGWLEDEPFMNPQSQQASNPFNRNYGTGHTNQSSPSLFAQQFCGLTNPNYSVASCMFGSTPAAGQSAIQVAHQHRPSNSSTGLFGAPTKDTYATTIDAAACYDPTITGSFFDSTGPSAHAHAQQSNSAVHTVQPFSQPFGALGSSSSNVTAFGQAARPGADSSGASDAMGYSGLQQHQQQQQQPKSHAQALQDYQMGLMVLHQDNPRRLKMTKVEDASPSYMQQGLRQLHKGYEEVPRTSSRDTAPTTSTFAPCSTSALPPFTPPVAPVVALTGEPLLHHLISLQTFTGSWAYDSSLFKCLGLDETTIKSRIPTGVNQTAFATALVIAVFEEILGEWEGSWELVVEKARSLLESKVGGTARAEEIIARAKEVLGN